MFYRIKIKQKQLIGNQNGMVRISYKLKDCKRSKAILGKQIEKVNTSTIMHRCVLINP